MYLFSYRADTESKIYGSIARKSWTKIRASRRINNMYDEYWYNFFGLLSLSYEKYQNSPSLLTNFYISNFRRHVNHGGGGGNTDLPSLRKH